MQDMMTHEYEGYTIHYDYSPQSFDDCFGDYMPETTIHCRDLTSYCDGPTTLTEALHLIPGEFFERGPKRTEFLNELGISALELKPHIREHGGWFCPEALADYYGNVDDAPRWFEAAENILNAAGIQAYYDRFTTHSKGYYNDILVIASPTFLKRIGRPFLGPDELREDAKLINTWANGETYYVEKIVAPDGHVIVPEGEHFMGDDFPTGDINIDKELCQHSHRIKLELKGWWYVSSRPLELFSQYVRGGCLYVKPNKEKAALLWARANINPTLTLEPNDRYTHSTN